MKESALNNLISTWLRAQDIDVDSSEYVDVAWSINELYDFAHRDPHQLLTVMAEILKILHTVGHRYSSIKCIVKCFCKLKTLDLG